MNLFKAFCSYTLLHLGSMRSRSLLILTVFLGVMAPIFLYAATEPDNHDPKERCASALYHMGQLAEVPDWGELFPGLDPNSFRLLGARGEGGVYRFTAGGQEHTVKEYHSLYIRHELTAVLRRHNRAVEHLKNAPLKALPMKAVTKAQSMGFILASIETAHGRPVKDILQDMRLAPAAKEEIKNAYLTTLRSTIEHLHQKGVVESVTDLSVEPTRTLSAESFLKSSFNENATLYIDFITGGGVSLDAENILRVDATGAFVLFDIE